MESITEKKITEGRLQSGLMLRFYFGECFFTGSYSRRRLIIRAQTYYAKPKFNRLDTDLFYVPPTAKCTNKRKQKKIKNLFGRIFCLLF